MNIVLIGATGFVGAPLLLEALQRGHRVTAVVRSPGKLPQHDHLRAESIDLHDVQAIARIVAGHDAVLSAFNPDADHADVRGEQLAVHRAIVDGVRSAGLRRLLVVGGAGSLEVAPGVQVLDTPEFPADWRAGAEGTRDVLHLLRESDDLDWTFLSPSLHLEPGERTGRFRLGTDQVLFDTNGESRISLQDYAAAMIDELESAAHVRQRFTVGY